MTWGDVFKEFCELFKEVLTDLSRDDVAAVAVVSGLIGGCVLLGLRVGWYAGLGLFFALLVLWGVFTLRSLALGHDGDLAAERAEPET